MTPLHGYFGLACVYCRTWLGVVQVGEQPRRTVCDDVQCQRRHRLEQARD